MRSAMLHALMQPFRLAAGLVAAGLFLTSCLTLEENRQQTIDRLENQVIERPRNPVLLRDLGVEYFHTGDYERAEDFLSDAFIEFSPGLDGKNLFYLALAHDAQDAMEQALQLYALYDALPPTSEYRLLMEGRYRYLQREMERQALRERIVLGEVALGTMDADAVAVFPLRYEGTNDTYAQIGRGLSALTIVDLGKIRGLRVVERLRLNVLLQELELAALGVVDSTTAARSGLLLSAGNLVVGSYNVPEGERLTVDAELIDALTESAADLGDVDLLSNFFQVQKNLVFQIVDALDLDLTPLEREELEDRPTENLQAFLAYCRGLALEYEGRFQAAAQSYSQAVRADPGFSEAREQAEAAATITPAVEQWPTLLEAVQIVELMVPRFYPGGLLDDRLQSLGGGMGSTILPGPEQVASPDPTSDPLPPPLPPPPPPSTGGGNR